MPRLETPDPFALEIGNRIKALLEQKRWTIDGLAKRMNGSKGHVSNVIKGLVRITIHTLYRFALALEVDPRELLPQGNVHETLVERVAQLSKEQSAANPVRKKRGRKKKEASQKPARPERKAT